MPPHLNHPAQVASEKESVVYWHSFSNPLNMACAYGLSRISLSEVVACILPAAGFLWPRGRGAAETLPAVLSTNDAWMDGELARLESALEQAASALSGMLLRSSARSLLEEEEQRVGAQSSAVHLLRATEVADVDERAGSATAEALPMDSPSPDLQGLATVRRPRTPPSMSDNVYTWD